MKFLVTGGLGFIGSAVVRKLIRESDHQVHVVDVKTYAATPESLSLIQDDPRYCFTCADIRDPQAMAQIFESVQPDIVMHLAAESHVDRSIDAPTTFIETNIVGTMVLLQAARKYFNQLSDIKKELFRFHHISTDEVFGTLSADDAAFVETTAYDPRSPYSASKASSDHLVKAWHETYGLPTVLSNCSNNYGPWQHPEKLIPVMIAKALDGVSLPVYGTGENIRDWLHVEDHASALILIATRGRVGSTYNVGGNAERTNLDVVNAICHDFDLRFPERAPHDRLISFVTDRPGHDFRYAIDCSKIKSDLGWQPSFEFESGLSETIHWYVENEGWWRAKLAKTGGAMRLGLGAN